MDKDWIRLLVYAVSATQVFVRKGVVMNEKSKQSYEIHIGEDKRVELLLQLCNLFMLPGEKIMILA